MEENSVTGKILHEKKGLTPQTVSKYVNGKGERYDLNVILDICEVCNVDPIPVIFEDKEILESASSISSDYTGLSVEDFELLHRLPPDKRLFISKMIKEIARIK